MNPGNLVIFVHVPAVLICSTCPTLPLHNRFLTKASLSACFPLVFRTPLVSGANKQPKGKQRFQLSPVNLVV